DRDLVETARITYCEGYLWDLEPTKEAIRLVMRIAGAAGNRVALTLSDGFCVDRHRGEFRELVRGPVDVLFANEAEITSLYEVEAFDAAVELARADCELSFVTRGARGSVVVSGDETHAVEAVHFGAVVDTTGAGDQYAAAAL